MEEYSISSVSISQISVPILIDDLKKYDTFQMTRCTYFSIECDVPSPGWQLGMENQTIPFLMFGLFGIVFKPFEKSPIFLSPDSIDSLFNTIEENPSLFIDTNDIWLPNKIFPSSPKRGEVYRVDYDLFKAAYLFREYKMSEDKFLEICRELGKGVRYSPEETESFRGWAERQIEKAKRLYPKKVESALKYP